MVQPDGFLYKHDVFTATYPGKAPDEVTKDIAENLVRFETFFLNFVDGHEVRAAAVERLSVAHNMNTVRRIAYFEGAALAVLGACMVPVVVTANVATARSTVFGKGVVKAKTDVVRHVHNEGGVYNALTPDECDALVMARYAAIRYGATTQ